jgi:peptide/nickel transport system permease protein
VSTAAPNAEAGAARLGWRHTELYALGRFVVRRLVAAAAVLLVVSILIFALVELLPGDAALLRSSQSILQGSDPAVLAEMRHELGLDRPATTRYADWLGGLLRGDLGTSLIADRPVTEIIEDRLGNTLVLGGLALLVSLPAALLLGIVAGTREGRRADYLITGASLALVAIPEFVLAAVLIVLFAFALGILPAVSLLPGGESPLAHPDILVLPVATLGLGIAAFGARFVRASVAEVMRSRYVEMARLNGVPERRVILRHVLPNALAPSVQVLAALTAVLVGGSVLVETIFAYPGLGATLASSVSSQDGPVVEGVGMLVATVLVVAYLLADLLLILLIPKLRTTA